jgi:hypothetical protein
MQQIRNKDFHKFNVVAKEVAAICKEGMKKLGISQVRQTTATFVQFCEQATDLEPKYISFVKKMQAKTSGEPFAPASIKGVHRSFEKMGMRVAEDPWIPDNVCDGVRGAVVYGDMMNMLTVLWLFASASRNPELKAVAERGGFNAKTAGIHEEIDILRVKNRFDNPTSGGWADFMISFRFADDPNGHICEVQLIHDKLMTVRKQMGAHHEYAEFRSALELLEATGNAKVIEDIEAREAASTAAEEDAAPVEMDDDRQTEAILELSNTLKATQGELADAKTEIKELRDMLQLFGGRLAAVESKV